MKRFFLFVYIMFLLGFVPTTVSAQCSGRDSLLMPLRALLQQYPEATLLDVYKSAFQNRYGPGHIISGTEKPKEYIIAEMQREFKHQNPYYEPTIPDSAFYRVNLSVIKEEIVPFDIFFDAFIRSVENLELPNVSVWAEEWHALLEAWGPEVENLNNFDTDRIAIDNRLEQGIYEGNHSDPFMEAYDPHYRIIRKDLFEKELKHLIDNRLHYAE